MCCPSTHLQPRAIMLQSLQKSLGAFVLKSLGLNQAQRSHLPVQISTYLGPEPVQDV